MRPQILWLLMLMFSAMGVNAQKTVERVGEVERAYHCSKNITPEEAEARAIRAAQMEIIANEFGTNILNFEQIDIKRGDFDFTRISTANLNGTWVKTISESAKPQLDENGELFYHVKLKGKVRKENRAKAEFRALLLCNGTEEHCVRTDFRDGNRLYLSFQAAEDGHLAVFVQTADSVYRMLPMPGDSRSSIEVKAQERRVFFDGDKQFHTETDLGREVNFVYILFSSEKILNPLFDGRSSQYGTDVLPCEAFVKWHEKILSRDKDLQSDTQIITIEQ